MNKEINFESIKKLVLEILNDKKKRQVVLLALIIILILFLLVRNNKSNNIQTNINNIESYESESGEEIVLTSVIYVDISGEVITPGVYKVKSDTRLFEVIELAGGLTDDADIDSLNQAEIVYDGQKIIVGSIIANENQNDLSSGNSNGKVSINNADSLLLQTLPGIGPTKAQKIIDYRSSNGRFKAIEDIKNVSGIGDATFEAIKDLICL